DHCRNLQKQTANTLQIKSGPGRGANAPRPVPLPRRRARTRSDVRANEPPGAARAKENRTKRPPHGGPVRGVHGAEGTSLECQNDSRQRIISALASMKNVAKCDTWCELQNPVNIESLNASCARSIRPGHVCLGVTHRVAPRPSRGGRTLASRAHPRAVGPNAIPRRRSSRPVVVERSTRVLSCRARRRPLGHHVGPKGASASDRDPRIPLVTASEPGTAQLENRAASLGGPGPSPLERGAGEGESPVVPGPCRTTRRCRRVGLFGNAAQSGGKFRPRLNTGERNKPRGGSRRSASLRLTGCSPVDSHTCQTPWSVFQDGSNGEPAGQRRERAVAEARVGARCPPRSGRRRSAAYRLPGLLAAALNPRWSAPRADRRTGSRRSTSDRAHRRPPSASLPTISSTLLTLFSKSFSSFPRGTLFAIGLSPVFSLGRNLPPDWGCIPKQPDSPTAPRGAAGSWARRGSHPLRRPFQGTWARSAAEDASPDYNSDSEAARFSSWAVPGSLAVTRGILVSFFSSAY
ncbi:UNVERIFIED_CONTAM: hypothetical protein Sindi_2350400, partial [Sesamum indicum]